MIEVNMLDSDVEEKKALEEITKNMDQALSENKDIITISIVNARVLEKILKNKIFENSGHNW
jgi:hypothetical protein